jgi:hypothetical protein
VNFVYLVLGIIAVTGAIVYGVRNYQGRHLRARNVDHREARRIEREYGEGSETDPNRKH